MLDITVSQIHGWALVTHRQTGRTGVCIAKVLRKELSFRVISWHDDFEGAHYMVIALNEAKITPNNYDRYFDEKGRPRTNDPAKPKKEGGTAPIKGELAPANATGRLTYERTTAAVAAAIRRAGGIGSLGINHVVRAERSRQS